VKKINNLKTIVKQTTAIKSRHQKIGLITGCFDILHAGHIGLFRFAKKHVDVLILGLENDETIRLSKGPDRPIHTITQRSEVLSELVSVDYIFTIPITVKFGVAAEIRRRYVAMVSQIKPDFLITSPLADKYWTQKRDSLKPLGIKLLKFVQKHPTSTSAVLNHLQKEL